MSVGGVRIQERFIARQPIFNRSKRVVGYELLFRDTPDNAYLGKDHEVASKNALDTAVLVGLNVLSDGHSIFVNCARESILKGYVTLFPTTSTVVEVLENVEPDADVLSACRKLKTAGYRIALDDYVDHPRLAPLAELADIIKVDFRQSPSDIQAALVRKYAHGNTRLLAEKVETYEEFTHAVELGYQMFQGYFFCKPMMFSTRDVAGTHATKLKLLQKINAPELDFFQIEALIRSEPALSYRLFRYLNTATFSFSGEVKSIIHGLTLIGEWNVRKWLMVTCAALASVGKPPELVKLALVRARLCELLAPSARTGEPVSFILGLFSLMDALLDTSIQDLLEQVCLPPDVRAALLGEKNLLRSLYQLVLAIEAADWAACETYANSLHIANETLNKAYFEAVNWVQSLPSN